MITARTQQELQETLAMWRDAQESLAFVPTMGNLHAGHLKLVEVAREHCSRVVVSIFVNPIQFGPNEDFAAYPRTPDADLAKLAAVGTDLVFLPDGTQIYPFGAEATATIDVPVLSEALCGKFRPGHFRGVCTVVAKLLNLVQPDCLVLGEKDRQQLVILKRMIDDLFMPVATVGVPTVREPDGLAMSSRNGYLSAAARQQAAGLFAELQAASASLQQGTAEFAKVCRDCAVRLRGRGFEPEYIELRRLSDLALPDAADRELVILAAVRLAGVRLIDNLPILLG